LVYVGVGSNLGERSDHCRGAIKSLSEIPGVSVTKISSLIETDPLGTPPDSPRFINGVVELHTNILPAELLQNLFDIEKKFGRNRIESKKNESRTVDLDLLLFNQQVIETEFVTIPHPRMHLRRFVLEPLAEISPETIHPVLNKSINELLSLLS